MAVRVPSGRTVPPSRGRATCVPTVRGATVRSVSSFSGADPQLRVVGGGPPGGPAPAEHESANGWTRGGGEVAMPQTSPPNPDPPTPDPTAAHLAAVDPAW